jgi:hypothetical protein
VDAEDAREYGAYRPAAAPIVVPKPEAIAEMAGIRQSELQTISARLGRVCEPSRARWFAGAAVLALGGAVGGGFGLIPFLSTTPAPSSSATILYAALVGVGLVAALLCGLAYRALHVERADSVGAIKEDLDRMLAAYEDTSPTYEEVVREALRAPLQRMRGEARTNLRLLREASESGQYWKVTDNAPSTTEWKRNRELLEGQEGFEALVESAQEAAGEVDRVLTRRAFRMFRRGRRVSNEDRLPSVIDAVERLDSALDDAIAGGA